MLAHVIVFVIIIVLTTGVHVMAEMLSNNIAAHFHRCIITVTKVGRMFALVVKIYIRAFSLNEKVLKVPSLTLAMQFPKI